MSQSEFTYEHGWIEDFYFSPDYSQHTIIKLLTLDRRTYYFTASNAELYITKLYRHVWIGEYVQFLLNKSQEVVKIYRQEL